MPEQLQGKLVEAFKRAYKDFFGSDPHKSDSYSRIISVSHWERITGLLKKTEGRARFLIISIRYLYDIKVTSS